jgi:hypothetical protein
MPDESHVAILRGSKRYPVDAAARRSPHPMAPASRHRAPRRWSGSLPAHCRADGSRDTASVFDLRGSRKSPAERNDQLITKSKPVACRKPSTRFASARRSIVGTLKGIAAMPRSKPARCPQSDRRGVRFRSTAESSSRECRFFVGCQPEHRSESCLREGLRATPCHPG